MDSACKQEYMEDTSRSCCWFIVFLKIVLSVFPPRPGFLAILPSLCEFPLFNLLSEYSCLREVPELDAVSWPGTYWYQRKQKCFMTSWTILLFVVFAFYSQQHDNVDYIHWSSDPL